MKKPELTLIDGTAFCYRAFYGIRDLSTSFGQPTNAVFGFISILRKLFKDKPPVYAAVCFDVSKETFRQKKFVEYKINRPPMPDGLASQIPLIKEFVAAYGLPIFEKEGFEADDVISEFARKARSGHIPVTIITSDKDMLQLVGEGIEVLNPYKDDGLVYTVEKVV
ncbi:MAG: DNA polymerase I, partial [Candidatus Omnitrophica bacterium]|nr:DNA polymerase I [Candidatus Omnitrophota bacterium]